MLGLQCDYSRLVLARAGTCALLRALCRSTMFVQPQPDPKAEVSTWVSCHDREGRDGASRVLSFLLASGSCGRVPVGFFLPRASR